MALPHIIPTRFPSMLTRDFQLSFYDAVLPPNGTLTPGMLVAVPGAGKTSVLVHLAFSVLALECRKVVSHFHQRPMRAFVFVVDAMTAYSFATEWKRLDGGDTCTIVADTTRFDAEAFPEGLVIVTYQWAQLHVERLASVPAQIVILDEVHRSVAVKWRRGWSVIRTHAGTKPLRLGATATLCRTDEHVTLLDTDPFNDYYVGPVLISLQMSDAHAKGYVARVRLHEVVCPVSLEKGESRSLQSARKAPYLEHLLAPYLRFERAGSVVVFVTHPTTAETLAKRLCTGKDPARCCFYMTSDVSASERNCILKHFNNIPGECEAEARQLETYADRPRVMFTTVGQEGMNVASCTCVIQFNPTIVSGAFDAQRAGRAARRKEHDEPSDCFVLLTPNEYADRLTKHNARTYTTSVFGEEWDVDSSPQRELDGVYASEQGEAFKALVKAENGERDAMLEQQMSEKRAQAIAKKNKVNIRSEILKRFNKKKR